ncbi:MAG: ABC transporter ATP-binding protein [Pseudomonadota bacterium]
MRRSYELLSRVYRLSVPYGRLKLAGVFLITLLQGILQVLGVTSIFPFLAVAADPERIQNSRFGSALLEQLPSMSETELLTATGISAIVMLLLSSLTNVAASFLRNRYGQNYAHWLRLRLMRQLVQQPYDYFLQQNSAILHKKVTSDVSTYTNSILLPLLDSAAQLVTIGLLAITLFLVDPMISIGATLLIGGYYLFFFLFLSPVRSAAQRGLLEANRGASKDSLTFFNGIKTIKVHDVEEYFVESYARFSAVQAKILAFLPIYASAPRYLIEPVAFGGLVLYVLYLGSVGGSFVDMIPNLGVIALAGYRLIPAVQMLYGQLTQVHTMRHALDEVFQEFLSIERVSARSEGKLKFSREIDFENSIELKGVTFSYPTSKRVVLRALNLSIGLGDAVAILGSSGAGKSTLVDLLLGLHRPSSGELLVDNRAISFDDMSSGRSLIGYVPQDIYLVDDTIRRNIAIGIESSSVDGSLLQNVCRQAQLLDFVENELADGLDTIVGDRGVRLSGGQRQRIGLARALYRQPSLLILDEATSALDNETESLVTLALNDLRGEVTLIVIAHRYSTIEMIPRKYRLVDGQLVKMNETQNNQIP